MKIYNLVTVIQMKHFILISNDKEEKKKLT